MPRPDDPRTYAVFTISIYYYAEGSDRFASVDDYIGRNGAGMPGVEATAVEKIQLKAGAARRWELTLPGMGAPEVMNAPKTKDTFVVLPAAKGFFALNYTSAAELHAAHMPEFQRVLETFASGR